jgi:hypothetical protein
MNLDARSEKGENEEFRVKNICENTNNRCEGLKFLKHVKIEN